MTADCEFVDCPNCGHSNTIPLNGRDETEHECWLCHVVFVADADGNVRLKDGDKSK